MKQSHSFSATNISSGYDKKTVVNKIDLEILPNKITTLIGANACGKSTLLKTLTRLIKHDNGKIILDGTNIKKINTKELARTIGLLPQSPIVPEGISVADLIGRGRYPHQKIWQGWSKKDSEAVAKAMDKMNVTELANRSISELSGGQRQRVWIAMSLAQETDILFLDEPTTFLDISYQVEILDILKQLNITEKITIVMVLHDINLAARYSDHLVAMKNGELIAQGHPNDIVNKQLIKEVFNLDAEVIKDPISNGPLIVPKSKFLMSK